MQEQIRASENVLTVGGYMKDVQLDAKTKQTESGAIDYLTGKFIVQVAEGQDITIKVPYLTRYNKSGTENKKYATLIQFVRGQLPTMANLAEFKNRAKAKAQHDYGMDQTLLAQAIAKIDQTEASVVSIWCGDDFTFASKIEDNSFVNQEGKVVETLQHSLGFGNLTVREPEKVDQARDFHAKGRIEVVVQNVMEEANGEVVVNGVFFDYKGLAAPIKIYPQKDDSFDFAQMCLDELESGMTVLFHIDLKIKTETTQAQSTGGANFFGRPTIETRDRSYLRYETFGGELRNDHRAYDIEQVQQAVAYRKTTYLPSLIKEAEARAAQPKPQAQGFGFGTPQAQATGFGQPASTGMPTNPAAFF